MFVVCWFGRACRQTAVAWPQGWVAGAETDRSTFHSLDTKPDDAVSRGEGQSRWRTVSYPYGFETGPDTRQVT